MENKYNFVKARDKAKRDIRGLWIRNGTYYAQVTMPDPLTGIKRQTKIRLKDPKTASDATQAMYDLRNRIESGDVSQGGPGPTFRDFRQHYETVTKKAVNTMRVEKVFLGAWERFFGSETRIGSITSRNIISFRGQMIDDGLSPRTVNLHMNALKQLFKLAKQEGLISKFPMDGIPKIKEKSVECPLMTTEELYQIVMESLKHERTGKQFADVIILLMYSGARISETLSLTWDKIDWNQGQLIFTGDVTKNSETRRVDFNPNLKQHLLCMKFHATSDYLFPSIRTDQPVTTLKTLLNEIRMDTGLMDFTFHLTRHYFISMCVMGGIDFLTIARWVGHKDGGILIGKRYGHLSRQHMKDAASKLKF